MSSPGPASLASGPVRASAPPRALIAFLALVLTLAALGAYLAAGLFARGDGHATPRQAQPKSGFAVGDSVFTSFGAVAIEAVEKVAGPTASQLTGVTHGINGLIPPNKVQLGAFATMTNLTGRTVQYSPAQFSLLVGSKDAKPQPLTSASVKPGVLQPNASIDIRLPFVVPRKGQRMGVRFKDPARDKPFLIDLGRTSKTPQGALSNYHRH